MRQSLFEDAKGVDAQATNPLDGPSNARKKPPPGFAGAGYGGWRLAEATGPVEFPQQPALKFVEILEAGGDSEVIEDQILAAVFSGLANSTFGKELERGLGGKHFLRAEVEAQGRDRGFKSRRCVFDHSPPFGDDGNYEAAVSISGKKMWPRFGVSKQAARGREEAYRAGGDRT